jgi:hypothetical protein
MAGGSFHEHISHLWYLNDAGEEEVCSREQMVAYIEQKGNNSVWCPDKNPNLKGAWVHVHNNGRIKYVQTFADGRKSDNLLSLPMK